MEALLQILPTVIVLFAGVGGSSLGLLKAGFKELLALENDSWAIKNFGLNSNTTIWPVDIWDVYAEQLMSKALLWGRLSLDLLVATPPCQGFSDASGIGDPLDPRNGLFLKSLELIAGVVPKVFLIENVPGMNSESMIPIMNEIKLRIIEHLPEYEVVCFKVNCIYFGVPTLRDRLIFVGIHKDLYRKPLIITPPSIDLDTLRIGSVAPEIEQLRTGQSKKTSKFPHDFLTTITATEGIEVFIDGKWQPFSHFDHLMLRFSSFPADFKLEGTPAQKHRLIGNAVPPLLMYHLAMCIKEQILMPALLPPPINTLELN